MSTMTTQERQRLGMTEDDYIVVTLELREVRNTGQTVDHAYITSPMTEVSLTGERGSKYAPGRSIQSGGQIREDLAEITRPAPGWSLEEIQELAELWERWHLNTMRAACAHMPEDAHARWDRRERVECSAGSGYTYGSAWLTELVPGDVVDRLRHLMRDRSEDLYRSRGYDAAGKAYPDQS